MSEVRRAEIQKRLREVDEEYRRRFLAEAPIPDHETHAWPAEKRAAHDALWAEKNALEEELRNLG